MAGFDFNKQRIAHLPGGLKIEAGEWTGDISTTTSIPSTLSKLFGAFAWVDYSSAGATMVSGASLCSGANLDFSIHDTYVTTSEAFKTKLTYMAIGW